MAEEENNLAGFTASESKIIMVLMKHLKGDIDTDFDAAATELGYKNTKVLRDRWGQIKKKKLGGAATSTGSVEKITPNKGSGRKRAADDDASPKKRGRPKKAVKDEEKIKEEADAVETTEDLDGMFGEEAAV